VPHDPLAWIDDQLARLEAAGLRRTLRERVGPQQSAVRLAEELPESGAENVDAPLVNFGSNDYLALAADPRLARAAADATLSHGWGSGASPLVLGRSDLHARLERRLAEFEGAEAAILFPTGFAANAGAIAALAGPDDVIFSDELNHASIIDGCRLSGARVVVYPHCDVAALAALLGQPSKGRRLIVTDSLFSMHGDLAPLADLADLAERHNAMLLVDEAHATGVFGETGRGVCEHLGVEDGVPIRVGTLSKALGSTGGFVVGRRSVIDWLANRARPYVFSTAAPAAAAAASLKALELVASEPERRARVLEVGELARRLLAAAGLDCGNSVSQIVPVFLGEAAKTMQLAQRLMERGMFVPGIRPPSVPPGQSLLRISLSCQHSEAEVQELVAEIARAA